MLPATGNRLESACAFVQDVLWSASPRGDATLEPWIIRSVARQLTNHLASRPRQRFERVVVPFRSNIALRASVPPWRTPAKPHEVLGERRKAIERISVERSRHCAQ